MGFPALRSKQESIKATVNQQQNCKAAMSTFSLFLSYSSRDQSQQMSRTTIVETTCKIDLHVVCTQEARSWTVS
jgi:hypothetical protein